jgi:hypothetical protein
VVYFFVNDIVKNNEGFLYLVETKENFNINIKCIDLNRIIQSSRWAPVLRSKTSNTLFGQVNFSVFLKEIYKNKFKDLIWPSKLKYSQKTILISWLYQRLFLSPGYTKDYSYLLVIPKTILISWLYQRLLLSPGYTKDYSYLMVIHFVPKTLT